jgi:S-adenosylmethionine hydrolase
VKIGEPALYVNDILNIGLAINQGNFAEHYGIEPGPDQRIEIWK